MTDEQLRRKRGAPGAAQGGRRDGGQLRPGRTTWRRRARRRAHPRVVAGGRQTRLPRGEPARGVRRRRRRHVRAVAGDGRDGGPGLRAADDGGVAGDQRHDHQQVRHRRAEEALAARPRRRLDRRWRSRSPNPTPGRTRTRSPPPPVATAATGSCPARRSSSPESTWRDAVLVVGRTEEAKTGNLRPALFVVPTDTPGFTYTPIEMELVSPDRQFQVFIDNVRLPADALVGSEDAASRSCSPD